MTLRIRRAARNGKNHFGIRIIAKAGFIVWTAGVTATTVKTDFVQYAAIFVKLILSTDTYQWLRPGSSHTL